MDRRRFHKTVTATAAGLALGGKLPNGAAGSLPPDPLPVGAMMRLGCNRLWHLWPASNPGINDLTFSPDGRYLATLGYQDDHVFIWSVPDGRPVRDWDAQDADRGGNLLWTERGLYVASGGGLSLWEPLTASLIHRFTDEPMRGLAASADGRWIASAALIHGWVEIWDARTHQSITRLNTPTAAKPGSPYQMNLHDFLLSVAFSRCGRWLAASGYQNSSAHHIGGLVHCWDIAARRHVVRFFTNCGPVSEVAFTPTGQLLSAGWAGIVALWEPFEGRLVRDWPRVHTGNVYHSLAVNASGQIAIQREDGVRLWNPDPTKETMLCPARGFCNLAYSDNGRFVAVAAHSGRVDLYDAITGEDLSPADRHATQVNCIELTADGTVCLACLGYFGPHHDDNEIVLRDTRTGARLGAKPPENFQPLALAPVGTRIAGRLGEAQLAVWNWASGDVAVHPDLDPQAAAWHPDGQTLVAATKSGEVITWHLETGRGQRQPVSSSTPIAALAVGAGGRAVALIDNGDLFVWQLDRNDTPRRIVVPPWPDKPGYYEKYQRLALAPDSLSAAVTRGDGIVYAGALTGDELRPIYTHPPSHEYAEDGHTVTLRYTDAGRLLIAGTCTALQDNKWWYTGIVTDGASGEVVWRSPPQRMWGWTLAVTPDGQSLLTGHEDGTLLVWRFDGGSAG